MMLELGINVTFFVTVDENSKPIIPPLKYAFSTGNFSQIFNSFLWSVLNYLTLL